MDWAAFNYVEGMADLTVWASTYMLYFDLVFRLCCGVCIFVLMFCVLVHVCYQYCFMYGSVCLLPILFSVYVCY